MTLFHASCVEFQGRGILILGDSGMGKSDLALRLIDEGGSLISDDYVDLVVEENKIVAFPAPNIEGLIEVRGVGLMKCDCVDKTTLSLALEVCERDEIERLPVKGLFFEHETVKLPLFKFDSFAASAIAKIRMILRS